jgi:hypothetical protein
MKPGEGYMMLRNGDGNASFTYPFYELGSNFREDWTSSEQRVAATSLPSTTMSLTATVAGFETEEGDRLVAYSNGEIVGAAMVASAAPAREPLYLSIGGDAQQPIWFAIERDGEIVASTGEVMTFRTNAVIGSPDEPTAISFVHAGNENGRWYTIDGMQLQQKPKKKGLYIYNGKKIIVK